MTDSTDPVTPSETPLSPPVSSPRAVAMSELMAHESAPESSKAFTVKRLLLLMNSTSIIGLLMGEPRPSTVRYLYTNDIVSEYQRIRIGDGYEEYRGRVGDLRHLVMYFSEGSGMGYYLPSAEGNPFPYVRATSIVMK